MHNKGNIVALFVPEITPHRNPDTTSGFKSHSFTNLDLCDVFILKTKHLNDLCQNNKIKIEH